MRIVRANNISIYVRAKDHAPPHCHVKIGKDVEISVDVPLVEARYGAKISPEVRELIVQYLDNICDVWDRFHPPRDNNE